MSSYAPNFVLSLYSQSQPRKLKIVATLCALAPKIINSSFVLFLLAIMEDHDQVAKSFS